MRHLQRPLNSLRPLLLILVWLLALLPAGALASIPRNTFTAPALPLASVPSATSVAAGQPVALLTLHLDGLYEGGVLVRQNPWSMFDPLGLEPNKAMYESFDQALVESGRAISKITPSPEQDSPKHVEYRSDIFQDPSTSKFGYTTPYGIQEANNPGPIDKKRTPPGMTYAGVNHNHPGTAGRGDPQFSSPGNAFTPGREDTGVADGTGKPIGVVQFDGKEEWRMKKYVPLPGSQNDPSKTNKGVVTEYDPNSKSFGPVYPTAIPLPLKGAAPTLIGMEHGVYTYEYPGGKTQKVPINQSEAFEKSFEKPK